MPIHFASSLLLRVRRLVSFFFNDTATTEIYTLSLHDALPILVPARPEPPLALTDGQELGPGQALIAGTSGTAQLIDVAQVQGQVHAQAVHRVGELAERNPNETATIVRQWLSEQPRDLNGRTANHKRQRHHQRHFLAG